MLYSYLAIEHSEPQAYAQDISRRWAQRQRDGFQIDGIDEFTLDFREDGQKNLSLAEELAGLANSGVVSDAAFWRCSAFDLHLDRLLEIFKPDGPGPYQDFWSHGPVRFPSSPSTGSAPSGRTLA